MSIIASEISTKYFTFSKETGNFVTEVSDLPESFNPLSQIYDDACDKGFYLVSEKSGDKLLFVFSHTDGGEDVAGWWFEVVQTVHVQKNPKLCNIKVLIIND